MLRWADPWKVVINIDYYNCSVTLAPTWDWFAWIDNALIGFSLLYQLFLMASIKVKKQKRKEKKSTKANDSGTITISFYVLNFSTQLLSKKTVQLLQLELWLFNGGETMRMALLILPQRPHTFSRLLCLKFFKKES